MQGRAAVARTKRLATSPFCFEVASLIAFRATPLNQQPVAGIADETRCMGKCFFIVENSRRIHLMEPKSLFRCSPKNTRSRTSRIVALTPTADGLKLNVSGLP